MVKHRFKRCAKKHIIRKVDFYNPIKNQTY
uniref:Ribosomal protein S16 n=1 Tax=Astragalus scaberrimus TaxID=144149 RepID=A0A8E5JV84_9FABA|nr:ribosomal protein S16 [Astragalus scaberrimus]QVD40568.1 ribosomal protein S16 [Astragalus scaberrimus]